MPEFEELAIAGLEVKIDRVVCGGLEECGVAAPNVFTLGADGVATFAEGAETASREDVLRGCRACPVSALVAIDADGTVLVP